jgi:hypothetical protein
MEQMPGRLFPVVSYREIKKQASHETHGKYQRPVKREINDEFVHDVTPSI